MECKDCNVLWLEHWRGELDETRSAALRSHLSECAACRDEAGALSQLWQRLDWQPHPDPERLAEIQERLSAPANRRAVQPGAHWFQRLWPGRPLSALVYSCSLLVAGVLLGNGLHPAAAELSGEALNAGIAAGQVEASDLTPDSLVRLCAVPLAYEFGTL